LRPQSDQDPGSQIEPGAPGRLRAWCSAAAAAALKGAQIEVCATG
jgi:hypothetical protein